MGYSLIAARPLLLGLVALALVAGAVTGQRTWLAHRYAAGRADALAEVAAREPVYRDRVVAAAARTDTLWRTVTKTITRLDTLIRAVPESILVAAPTVSAALQGCSEVVNACAAFRGQVAVERLQRDSLTEALGRGNVIRSDSIKTLARRPTRLKALGWGLLNLGAGFALGRR